jgi:hypothetical protein
MFISKLYFFDREEDTCNQNNLKRMRTSMRSVDGMTQVRNRIYNKEERKSIKKIGLMRMKKELNLLVLVQ